MKLNRLLIFVIFFLIALLPFGILALLEYIKIESIKAMVLILFYAPLSGLISGLFGLGFNYAFKNDKTYLLMKILIAFYLILLIILILFLIIIYHYDTDPIVPFKDL
ncbi:hypothetical protein HYX07_01940 [Candidatus Woesearchaeota archaeon]|nr:hypothetical protein [Candidatus Woesearchaeota archaeon]